MNRPFILIFDPGSDCKFTEVPDNFNSLVESLKNSHHSADPSEKKYRDFLFVFHNDGFVKINIREIKYLTASRSYSVVHASERREFILSVPTSHITPFLPENDFARINRSVVVNLNYVVGLHGNTVTMSDKNRFTVSRQYRTELYDNFQFVGTKSKKYSEPSGNPYGAQGKKIEP